MGNIAHIVNAIVLITYFFLIENKSAWPQELYPLVWIPFFAHVYFHNFFDGLQNTTRNIARIYLIKQEGSKYNRSRVQPIQHLLIPDSMFKRTMIWLFIHVSSFSLLLFYQGWATAIIAEAALILLGGLIPINYQSHLRRIQKNLPNAISARSSFSLLKEGIYPKNLQELVDQAVAEEKNPQKWWGKTLKQASKNRQS